MEFGTRVKVTPSQGYREVFPEVADKIETLVGVVVNSEDMLVLYEEQLFDPADEFIEDDEFPEDNNNDGRFAGYLFYAGSDNSLVEVV